MEILIKAAEALSGRGLGLMLVDYTNGVGLFDIIKPGRDFPVGYMVCGFRSVTFGDERYEVDLRTLQMGDYEPLLDLLDRMADK